MSAPVFWFLGLPGSGKSTLAGAVVDHLRARPSPAGPARWELLDGDVMREFLTPEIGYSHDDRRKSVKIFGLLARQLSANGVGVVVASVSPFHDLRLFIRAHVPGYVEIYCRCPVSKCIERDPKGHYRKQIETGGTDFIGLSIPFQEPESPDLVVDTSDRPVAESIELARGFVETKLVAMRL